RSGRYLLHLSGVSAAFACRWGSFFRNNLRMVVFERIFACSVLEYREKAGRKTTLGRYCTPSPKGSGVLSERIPRRCHAHDRCLCAGNLCHVCHFAPFALTSLLRTVMQLWSAALHSQGSVRQGWRSDRITDARFTAADCRRSVGHSGRVGDIRRMREQNSEIVIKPGMGALHYWRELWRYRELFFFLAWRDILVRYKQTAIGIAWSVLRPLLTMIVFTVVFGKLAKLPSNGVPYPIMVFTAMLPWQFFANALTESSNSLIDNSNLLTKVYF